MRTMLTAMALATGTLIGLPLTTVQAHQTGASASDWDIGPVIRGRNYSVNMPAHPTSEGSGWSFAFPYPHPGVGNVHYVTTDIGTLAGARQIIVRYRVDAAPGVQFIPQQNSDVPATVSLYFQRRGDDWSARGQYAWYRWYAPPATVAVLTPGVHEMTVDLDGSWGSVNGQPASDNPRAFEEALADVNQLGIVFGSSSARGHGVFATGPASFTLLDFRIR